MSSLTESDEAIKECCKGVATMSAQTIARLTQERDEAVFDLAALITEIDAARASHAERGYDAAHDAEHGLDHLHRLAEHYALRRTHASVVKAVSLLLAAADLRSAQGAGAPSPRPEQEIKAEALEEAAREWSMKGWSEQMPHGTSRPALIIGMAQGATNWLLGRAEKVRRGEK